MITPLDVELPTQLVFGQGALDRLGAQVREMGSTQPLLVADDGLCKAGHVDRVTTLLGEAGIRAVAFHDFDVNPDTAMVERAAAAVRHHTIDGIIGLGGGSSLDCAKGINFILSNGGTMRDFRGYGQARHPMLPMLAIPTTAGTGSEAQSYAVIADADTGLKMACGDPKAAFRVALLDPDLTVSQPAAVTAAAGYDAIAHAVETAVTTRGTDLSRRLSREAFCLLNEHIDRVLRDSRDLDARAAMHLGAFYAGAAIEHSMLGAAHACANPLTARYGLAHGVALAVVLPHVVRWNARDGRDPYDAFVAETHVAGSAATSAERLADRLTSIAEAGRLPGRLRAVGVDRRDLPSLAELAAQQWTGSFNPRPFGAAAAQEVYQCAY